MIVGLGAGRSGKWIFFGLHPEGIRGLGELVWYVVRTKIISGQSHLRRCKQESNTN